VAQQSIRHLPRASLLSSRLWVQPCAKLFFKRLCVRLALIQQAFCVKQVYVQFYAQLYVKPLEQVFVRL